MKTNLIKILLLALLASKPASAQDIKIMVLDSGIGKHSALSPYVQYDNSANYIDSLGHGTHVAGIVAFGNEAKSNSDLTKDALCKNVKIYSCNVYGSGSSDINVGDRFVQCIKLATKEKMNAINISGGGDTFIQEEYEAIKEYTDHGGWIVAAAGNRGHALKEVPYYPAAYHIEYVAVGNKKPRFRAIKRMTIVTSPSTPYAVQGMYLHSNEDNSAAVEKGIDILSTLPNNEYGRMTGTSMATPAFLHKVLKNTCKRLETRK